MKYTGLILSIVVLFTGYANGQQLVDGVAAIVGQEMEMNRAAIIKV